MQILHLLGLIWPLRGLTKKGKDTKVDVVHPGPWLVVFMSKFFVVKVARKKWTPNNTVIVCGFPSSNLSELSASWFLILIRAWAFN
jgi:hypothetical protein